MFVGVRCLGESREAKQKKEEEQSEQQQPKEGEEDEDDEEEVPAEVEQIIVQLLAGLKDKVRLTSSIASVSFPRHLSAFLCIIVFCTQRHWIRRTIALMPVGQTLVRLISRSRSFSLVLPVLVSM